MFSIWGQVEEGHGSTKMNPIWKEVDMEKILCRVGDMLEIRLRWYG
jgi:hypothetical protein